MAGEETREDWSDQAFQACMEDMKNTRKLSATDVRIGAEQGREMCDEAGKYQPMEISLIDCEFTGAVDFSSLKMADQFYANFSYTTFSRHATFSGTTFSGDAAFFHTTFSRNAYFSDTTFSGNANFSGATFDRTVDFSGVRFTRHVELSNVGSLRALNAHFEAGVRVFSRPGSEIDLYAAHFGGPSLISVFEPEEGQAVSSYPAPKITSLRMANVELLIVSGIDLSECRFEHAHGLSGMGIEGATMFGRIERNGLKNRLLPPARCVIAEEKAWRDQDDFKKRELENLVKAASVESTYRGLRVGLEKRHETGLAGDFYYGEMEMRRRGTEPRAVRGLLVGYWALSGYGTRALRTFGWLLLMLIAFTLAYDSYSSLNFNEAALLSLESSVSLLRPPDTPALSDVGPYLVIFQRLVGTLLFGLFLLALRARVKR